MTFALRCHSGKRKYKHPIRAKILKNFSVKYVKVQPPLLLNPNPETTVSQTDAELIVSGVWRGTIREDSRLFEALRTLGLGLKEFRTFSREAHQMDRRFPSMFILVPAGCGRRV